MDDTDRKLLAELQSRFPLTPKPFEEIGRATGISGDEVIKRIGQLKESEIIRQISPVFDARALGYVTTLVAMRVPEEKLDNCADVLVASPYISHAYERTHAFNVWFTLAMPGEAAIEQEIKRTGAAIPADTIFQLPYLKLYKIGAFFDADEAPPAAPGKTRQAGELTQDDRKVVNRLQQDLPLTARPFLEMSGSAGMDEDPFLEKCASLRDRGIMRRYGAAINHRRVGYTANGMVCFEVPPEKTENAGIYLASLREVSHCYERRTNAEWPYNLFAMVHGKTRETTSEIAENASKHLGLDDYRVLFSTREIKKTRIKYPV